MKNSVSIYSINTNFLNQYSASPEELLAEAMEQYGLLDESTVINNILANDHLRNFREKKRRYHGILTRKGSIITKLGSMLLQKNVISTAQLKEALNYQKHTPIRIGEILVRLGFVREEEISEIIEEQGKIRNVLEKMNETKSIQVSISYREPHFEKTIERDSTDPFVITEEIQTNDIADAILEALTKYFDNEKKNSVNWRSEIVGLKVNLDFEKESK